MREKLQLLREAGSGIGAAVSRLLGREGAEVIVADLNGRRRATALPQEIRSLGGSAHEFVVDVADAAAVEKLVEYAVQKCGSLDVAVNNAGISGTPNATVIYSFEDWHRLININLNGVFYCMKYEIAAMLGRGGGAIVNMSSILGSVGLPSAPAYTAAKHAVVGLAKAAAMEYAKMGNPHQCRWAGLDRYAASVGVFGGGKQTHGGASAYGQARNPGRGCSACVLFTIGSGQLYHWELPFGGRRLHCTLGGYGCPSFCSDCR